MTQRSLCPRITEVTLGSLIMVLSFSLLLSVSGAYTEYLELTARGSSMDPTILDGDRLTVKLRVNAALINVSDIVVYCTFVTGEITDAMWIGHRVIDKYMNGNTWCFKTKGDNNSEADSWTVPDYSILGVVVNIEHVEQSQPCANSSSEMQPSLTTPSETLHSEPLSPEGSQAAFLTAGSVGVVLAIAVLSNIITKRQNRLRNANVISCFTCRYYEIQYLYRVQSANGRIGLEKVQDFSRGFCRYFNMGIVDFPRRYCDKHKSKDTYLKH